MVIGEETATKLGCVVFASDPPREMTSLHVSQITLFAGDLEEVATN